MNRPPDPVPGPPPNKSSGAWPHSNVVDFAMLGLLALLWGSSYTLIAVAVRDIPPLTLIAARVSIAAGLLLAVLHWRRERLPRDARTWRMLLLQAFFNSIGAWTILAWGQQHVDSGLASVLNSTSPIFVFLFVAVLSRDGKPNGIKAIGAFLGFAGVVMIVGVDALAGLGAQVAGQLAVLAGAVLYARAAIYGRKLNRISALAAAAGTMLWATVFLVPASLILEQPWTLRPTPIALAATLALAVFCTGLALLLYFRLVRTLGSLGVASQSYLRAGVGVVLGTLVLGERIGTVMGIGLACILLGVVAMNLNIGSGPRPRNRTSSACPRSCRSAASAAGPSAIGLCCGTGERRRCRRRRSWDGP